MRLLNTVYRALLLTPLVLGCGSSASSSSHAIAVSVQDRSCSSDADCVPVYEGALGCCGGGCPNSAINKTAYPDYEADVASREPVCVPALPCVFLSNDVCKAGAACRDGLCQFASQAADSSPTR